MAKITLPLSGVFDTDLGRLVGVAPEGSGDVTYLPGLDTPYAPVGAAAPNFLAAQTVAAQREALGIYAPAAITSPDEISGLSLWLDAQQPLFTASYAAQCAALGDSVAIWPDASGIIGAAAPGTAPTFDPTGINGLPAVKFNGTNQYLLSPAFLDSSYNNAMTMFIVFKGNAQTDFRVLVDAANKIRFSTNPANGTPDIVVPGVTGWGSAPSGTLLQNSGIIGASVGTDTMLGFFDRAYVTGLAGSVVKAGTGTLPVVGNSITGGLAFSTAVALDIGRYSGATYYFPGWIGEVLVYKAALTADQMRQVREYLAAKWGFDRPLVVCGGDSLTSGYGTTLGESQKMSLTGTSYPCRLYAALGTDYDVRTDSVSGRAISVMISESPHFSDLLVVRGDNENIYVMDEWTNTLNASKSVGAALSQYKRFCKARKRAGFKVIVTTPPYRKDASKYAGYNNDQAAIISHLRAHWPEFADEFCDLSLDSRLADADNTTYFNADKLHLIEAGLQVKADLIHAAVLRLL